MRSIRKHYFSLLELILALTILLVVSGVISIRVYNVLHQHRFKNNEKRITYFLHHSYCMALSHQTDIIMTLIQKKKGLQCEIAVEGDMGLFEDQAKENFYLKDFYLKGISKTKNKRLITFTSTGVVFPDEKYVFYGSKESLSCSFTPSKLFQMEEKEEKIKKLYPTK